MKRGIKKRYIVLVVILVLILAFIKSIYVSPPPIEDRSCLELPIKNVGTNEIHFNDSWLRKKEDGLYEMYITGSDFERGVAIGKLSQDLIAFQEKAFIEGIEAMVPSSSYLSVLKYFVAWKNRLLQKYVPKEYQREIYGMSIFASDEYDFVGPKFQRKLYYHAAHDIGHTVQNMGLIGCSAFSVNGNASADGKMLVGRNFDFYVGDAFAKNKVLLFMNPDEGIPFASYSWPGFIGVVSGINKEGLSVSLNAGPPALPSKSKVPVSILAREILQYATNLEEAINIAASQDIFVSESFLIASAKDNKSIIIEKTPESMSIVPIEQARLVLTNHFQSDDLKELEMNLTFKEVSSTSQRFDRMNRLLDYYEPLDLNRAVSILRDWKDDEESQSGVGNEISINQMIAHHSIIFKPQENKFWISTGLNPMDRFLHYDLDDVFGSDQFIQNFDSLTIAPSPWLDSKEKENYLSYKKMYRLLEKNIAHKTEIAKEDFEKLIALNPNHYKAYLLAGEYYNEKQDCENLVYFLDQAKEKRIPWKSEKDIIKELLENCKK